MGSLANDPALHGVVRDEHGSVKVADHDSARLLDLLREPQRVEGELARDELSLVRLVLDGLLEVWSDAGGGVTGIVAYDIVCETFSLPAPATKTARVSQMALQHAQRLEIEDALRVSVRLYFYGRLATSPSWLARYPTRDAIERFLHIEQGGTLAQRMRRAWQAVDSSRRTTGGFFGDRGSHRAGSAPTATKLYVSPLPESVPAAFSAAVGVARRSAQSRSRSAMTHPRCCADKIVLYFADLDSVFAAPPARPRARGCRAMASVHRGLAGSDGLLSRYRSSAP